MKELSRRAKQKRKQDMEYYGNQKEFAQHIGMTYRRYQQFEINGKITLEKFIDVLRGLNALDKIQGLLELGDESLFKEENPKKKTKSSHSFSSKKHTEEIDRDEKIVTIPDVFD